MMRTLFTIKYYTLGKKNEVVKKTFHFRKSNPIPFVEVYKIHWNSKGKKFKSNSYMFKVNEPANCTQKVDRGWYKEEFYSLAPTYLDISSREVIDRSKK